MVRSTEPERNSMMGASVGNQCFSPSRNLGSGLHSQQLPVGLFFPEPTRILVLSVARKPLLGHAIFVVVPEETSPLALFFLPPLAGGRVCGLHPCTCVFFSAMVVTPSARTVVCCVVFILAFVCLVRDGCRSTKCPM